jgi:hypothetical protein
MVRKQVKPKSKRVVAKTLLIMCEGAADAAFVTHLKQLFEVRGSGWKITVDSANGKGARNVVNQAIRCVGAFDKKAVFFDIDVGYDEQTKTEIKQHSLIELACEPCFEAVLLIILGQTVRANETSEKLKAQWRRAAGLSDGKVSSYKSAYSKQFNRDSIERAAASNTTLAEIMRLFEARVNS